MPERRVGNNERHCRNDEPRDQEPKESWDRPSPGPPDCLWRKMTPRLTAAAMAICTRIFQLIRITICPIPPLSTMFDSFGLGKSDVRSSHHTPVAGVPRRIGQRAEVAGLGGRDHQPVEIEPNRTAVVPRLCLHQHLKQRAGPEGPARRVAKDFGSVSSCCRCSEATKAPVEGEQHALDVDIDIVAGRGSCRNRTHPQSCR